jgi:hypothetical protein
VALQREPQEEQCDQESSHQHTDQARTEVIGQSGRNALTVPARQSDAAAMTSRISHTSFDAADAYRQSLFWSRVLDFVEDPDDPNEPGHEECLITSRDRLSHCSSSQFPRALRQSQELTEARSSTRHGSHQELALRVSFAPSRWAG